MFLSMRLKMNRKKKEVNRELARIFYGFLFGILVLIFAKALGYTNDSSAIMGIITTMFIYIALKLKSIK